MNSKSVFHLIGFLLLVIGLSLALTWLISIYFDDPQQTQQGLLFSALISIGIGILVWALTRHTQIELSRRDGFAIATLGWLSASLVGALPFIFSGVIASPVGAVFETMSGFTTTGASVLTALEELPRGIIFWRSLTHFFGGMGVLVLCIAILPFLKVGGMQIYRAEMPGPSKDKLTPRIENTAKLLWGVYILFSVLEAGLLRIGGMPWFDAVCHTFATMATGGFSTQTASIGAYNSVYIEIVIIVFMFLAGTNFALHFRMLRGKPLAYFRDPEFRFYLGLWLGAALIITFSVWGRVYQDFGESLRAAFFQTTSIMTTTGYATTDFNVWPNTARVLLVILMFVGGSAGSTGGGMKNIRIFTMLKSVIREIHQFMRPQAVLKTRIGKTIVKENTISNIVAFIIIFILIFALGSLVMSFFTPDFETAISSTIATLGNIGPGLNAVGPVANYADIPVAGQGILTFFMLLGRLELYTVLVMFLPVFWRH